VVLLDHIGNILLSTWDVIIHCQSAAAGEAIAFLEGFKLGFANCSSYHVMEIYCASMLESFSKESCDRPKVCYVNLKKFKKNETIKSTNFRL
jgi:hypothetical protein